jgi:hypothetical protein
MMTTVTTIAKFNTFIFQKRLHRAISEYELCTSCTLFALLDTNHMFTESHIIIRIAQRLTISEKRLANNNALPDSEFIKNEIKQDVEKNC